MLDTLPPELLAEVVQYVTTAKRLSDLSLTCHALHDYVEAEGWKVFVRSQYPYTPLPPKFVDWKNAAHGLATLSRNLKRRAFLATYPEPGTYIHSLPDHKIKTTWQRPKGQTMGFQPMLDSYSTFTGSSWRSQKEVVAWGAGAELVIRRQERGTRATREWRRASPEQRKTLFGEGRVVQEWFTYSLPGHREGHDDITSVNLVRPGQLNAGSKKAETVVVGRASGKLTMLEVSETVAECTTKDFDTADSPVRSARLSSGPDPRLAVCLGDERIALYSCQAESDTAPISAVHCTLPEDRPSTRTWTTAFLSDTHLAVGRGPSKDLIVVYDLRPDGLTQTPLRTFGAGRPVATSVYEIAPLPNSSSTFSTSADLFLSGGYDGLIRLHDMRSPSGCELTISDPIDHSPIFSLLTIGRERVVAGGGTNNLLKFFDLRRPDRRAPLCAEARAPAHPGWSYDPDPCSGWNLFGQLKHRGTMQASSPVYALSRPSPWSPCIYAGMENCVLQLTFTAAHDDHPDPVFRGQVRKGKDGRIDARRTWNPSGNAVQDLTMYEHTEAGNFVLLNQDPVQRLRPVDAGQQRLAQTYDARWRAAVSNRAGPPHMDFGRFVY